ncbi:MAG: DUF4350 domain-containing protein [Planctomycetota bacterium]
MNPRLEKVAAGVVLALLVLLALAAQFLTPAEDSEDGSAASSEPGGRRALLLLLRELGFRAETWNEAPGALPRGGGIVWLARTPSTSSVVDLEPPESKLEPEPEPEPGPEPAPEPEPEPATAETSPADFGLRALTHYRRFLEEGGTIILDYDDKARKFLVDELGLAACEDVHASAAAIAGIRHLRDQRGEELEVTLEEGGVLVPPSPDSSGEALWWGGTLSTEGEEVLATMVPVGSGQLVLLGDDSFLSNEKLGEHDHALFAVRLAEEFSRGGRILFDEYALGLWRPRTAMTLLASPELLLATLQVAALLLLALWSSAWVREFPRDPRTLEAASPLLRARALASLLVRAGRFDVLGRFLREGMLRRVARGSRRVQEAVSKLPASPCASATELERWNAQAKEIECETS